MHLKIIMTGIQKRIRDITILLFLILSGINPSFSQNYSIESYQKINELHGGFSGILDVNDYLGISIDNIGDLDGNGVNDLAVGAYGDDDGGMDRGAVWILFLDSNDMVISHTKISNTSGNFNGVLDNDDRFGGAVAYLGDMNGDGLIELAVAADYDGDGGFWHGAVWILSLNSDGTVNSHSKISDTAGGFTGFINGDAIFGTDIENIGDLNMDGVQDLAIGSRRDADGGSPRGAVWILFMNSDFTVNSYQKISDTEGGFNGVLEFEDYFGGSVLNIGDLDGDGITDIVVGCYRDDDGQLNSGSFYVLFLNSNGTVKASQKVSNLEGGFIGQLPNNTLFGESIDGVFDIDNDGKIEILVGALGHYNTHLSFPTGAFYIIELNNDGTVSEQHLYTYGENCFSGELNNGDFFGGAVTLLKNGGNISVAVGAYRDSENGFNKGAVWILNLGEISYDLQEVIHPTSCIANNGEIRVANLSPNTLYSISYSYEGAQFNTFATSNSNRGLQITGLSSGVYENIILTDTVTGCSDNIDLVTLEGVNLDLMFASTSPTTCSAANGSITLSNLANNRLYSISYFHNSSLHSQSITSNFSGELTITGLETGEYSGFVIEDTVEFCQDFIELITLEAPSLSSDIIPNNPSTCQGMDGDIELTGLSPNNDFTITYLYNFQTITLNFTSNTAGQFQIIGLSSGIYEEIILSDIITGCSNNLGSVALVGANLQFQFSMINPTSCAAENGSIRLSNLASNTLYSISYYHNSMLNFQSLTSNINGEVLISGLGKGEYSDIVIEDTFQSCQAVIESIILDAPSLSLENNANNPTSCDSTDGNIIITNLPPNADYTISYLFNSESITSDFTTNSSGELSIMGLNPGVYENIAIIGNPNNSCYQNIDRVELSCDNNNLQCFKVKNFFTPNNDGANDFWHLETINDCNYTVYIYDRYGKLLSVLTPNNPNWDGRYNGLQMPSNDYWYRINYTFGDKNLSLSSHFSLKR